MYGPFFLILGPIMKIIVFCPNIIYVASTSDGISIT